MIECTLIKTGPVPSVMKRELNNCHRDAMANNGRHWNVSYREKHFTNAGAGEYGYTPRDGERGRPNPKWFKRSYTGRKLRVHGHTRPLEFSGESRRRTRNPRIVAVAKKGEAIVRVVMNSPGLNRRYAGSPINMRDEMTRISSSEGQQITIVTSQYLRNRYGQLGQRTTKKF